MRCDRHSTMPQLTYKGAQISPPYLSHLHAVRWSLLFAMVNPKLEANCQVFELWGAESPRYEGEQRGAIFPMDGKGMQFGKNHRIDRLLDRVPGHYCICIQLSSTQIRAPDSLRGGKPTTPGRQNGKLVARRNSLHFRPLAR